MNSSIHKLDNNKEEVNGNVDISNFRTSSIFHYTIFNVLPKIITEGLIPNYCKEDLSENNGSLILGIPMVSFCDIPLTRTSEFNKRYGSHAIGLRKEWAEKNGINPILYFNNKCIANSLSNFIKMEQEQRNPTGSNVMTFNQFSNKKPYNLLLGYIKKYNGENLKKKTIQCNYEENEWRYVLKETDDIKWYWNKEEIDKWRGSEKNKPAPIDYFKERKLKFDLDDLTYIIVEKESQVQSMIDKISKMEKIGGNSSKITENDKKILISKIISMEKIKKDF